MLAQLDPLFLRLAPGRAASRLVGYSFFEGRPLTTKGRWWNPVVFWNLRLAASCAGRRVDRPVFIVGMGRSGTTLLGRILAAHPSVGFLNEPKAMWHVIRDDEDIIGSYAPAQMGRLYLDAEDADDTVIRRGHALFSWYLRASRSQRVVDKYPELIFRPAFVRTIFPDARFLLAVRSPWSVLRSVAAWSETNARHGANWWGAGDRKWQILWTQGVLERSTNADLAALALASEPDDRIRAAIEWIVTMREALPLMNADPNARVVCYEELAEKPQETIRQVLQFCELPPSPRTESYAESIIEPQVRTQRPTLVAPEIPAALAELLETTWADFRAAASSSS